MELFPGDGEEQYADTRVWDSQEQMTPQEGYTLFPPNYIFYDCLCTLRSICIS